MRYIFLASFLVCLSFFAKAQERTLTATNSDGTLSVTFRVVNPCVAPDNGYIEMRVNSTSKSNTVSASIIFIDVSVDGFPGGDPIQQQYDYPSSGTTGPIPVGGTYIHVPARNMRPGRSSWIVTDGFNTVNMYAETPNFLLMQQITTPVSITPTQSNNTVCTNPVNGQVQGVIEGGSKTIGTGSYTYRWDSDNGLAGLPLTGVTDGTTPLNLAAQLGVPGLPGGTYTLTITDRYSPCSATHDFTITDPSPIAQNITSPSPLNICANDPNITLNLSGSEVGVNYTIYRNSTATSNTFAGTGSALTMTFPKTGFSDGDTLRVRGVNGFCTPVVMNGYSILRIRPLPDPKLTGSLSVCQNQTLVVYGTDGFKTNYQWTVSAGGTITAGGGVNDSTVTVTWNTPGNQTVSINYTDVYGCTAVTPKSVTVNVRALPVLAEPQEKSICSGDAAAYRILLTPDNTPAGTVFNWADPDGAGPATAGVNVPAANAIHINNVLTNTGTVQTTTTYIVTPRYGSGLACPGDTVHVKIRVNPRPVLVDGQKKEICSGENVGWEIKLNPANLPAGTTFSWPDPDGAGPATAGTNVPMGAAGTIHINDALLNATTSNINVNYIITPTVGSCAGIADSVIITVKPRPVLADNQLKQICDNDAAAYHILLTPAELPAGTVFNWPDPDGAGPATAGVNVPMGTATTLHINDVLRNLTTTPLDVVYMVTPSNPLSTCVGITKAVTIRVNPKPVLADAQAVQICSGDNVGWEIKLNPLNLPTGTTFSWADPDGAGPATAGTNVPMGAAGTIHINDLLTNTGTTNLVINYVITPRTGSCDGVADTVQVTVRPRPVVLAGQTKTICSDDNTAYHILLNPAELPLGTIFNWPDPDGAGPATAGVNVPMGTATTLHINDVLTNTGTAPIQVTYVVTPSLAGGCTGTPTNIIFTVNPKPVLLDAQAKIICAGDAVAYHILLNPAQLPTGTTFSWADPDGAGPATARTNVAMGTAATIHINDILTNATSSDIVVNYVIVPRTGTCVGIADTVQVTVRPRPVVAAGQSKIICSGDAAAYHILLNPLNLPLGTVFNWPDPDGAGPATAGVNVPMGTATTIHINDVLVNNGTTNLDVTYVVTPSHPSSACPGAPQNILIRVRPVPVVANNQTKEICSGDNTAYHILLSPLNLPTGTTFSWPDPDGAGPATAGTNVAMGTAATLHINNTLTNATGADLVVNYVITPRQGTCDGVADTVRIVVKPRPVLVDKQAKTICTDDNTAYHIRLNPAELPTGTLFNWPDPDGAGPATAGVNVPMGTAATLHINDVLTNTGTTPIQVSYIVTPTVPGGPGTCPGVADTIVFTVNPKPVLANNQAKTICAGEAVDYHIQLTPLNLPTGTTFSWSDPDGAGPATAGVNVPMGIATTLHITDVLTNTTAADIVVNYVITPSLGTCAGVADTVKITVKPRPVLADNQFKEICSGDNTAYHILLNPVNLPAGTVFNWADPDGAGPATAGVNVPMGTAATLHIQDVLTNTTTAFVDVRYIITPSHPASGCAGVADTVVIRVHPIPVLADGQQVAICSGDNVGWEIKLNPLGLPVGTTFSWADPDGAGPATAGVNVPMGVAGTIHINDVLTNVTGVPVVVNYVITPSRGGLCAGVADTVKVTVNPGPALADNQFKQICTDEAADYHIMLNPAELPVGTVFNWADPDGAGPATAGVNVPMGTATTLHITDVLTNTTSAPIDVLYIITPSNPAFSCVGEPDTVVIRVNPIPVLADGQETTICAGDNVGWEIKLSPLNLPTGTTFSWADPDGAGPATARTNVPMGAAGTIHISDVLANATTTDIVVNYVIVPTVGTCAGEADTVKVTVKPRPVLVDKQAKTICSGDSVKYQVLLNPAGLPAGTVFNWADPDGAGPATAGVNVPASAPITIDDVLVNAGTTPLVVRYIITPTHPASSCVGLADTVEITVNPRPVLVDGQEAVVCSGDAVGYSIRLNPAGLPANTTFSWADPDGTGPATAGVNVPVGTVGTVHINDILLNTSTTDLVLNYIIVPTAGASCAGVADTVKVTVKARPVLADNQSKVICSGDTVNYEILLTPAGLPLGTTFSWPDPDGAGPATAGTNVPMGAAGTFHIKDILTNTGVAPITVTYVVTPDNATATCAGTAKTVVITVNPAPNAGTDTVKPACNDDDSYDLLANLNGSPDAGGTWTDLDASGATIVGNIIDLTSLSGGNSYRFRYIVDGGGICKPDTAVLTLNIEDAPYAGGDGAGTVCTLETAYNLYNQLAPIVRTPDTNGTWADIDGSGAVITGHLADFTSVAVGTYTFRYIVPATTACQPDTAFVEIDVIDTAPDAGNDSTVTACNNNNAYNLFDQLGGNPDAGGVWRDLDGVGRPIVANVISLVNLAAGQYHFRYVLDVPGCGKDSAVVTLNINDALSAGESDTLQLCNVAASVNLFTSLAGAPDTGGTWTELTASGRPISPAGVVDLSGVANGTYRFRYIVTNTAPCVNDTAIVTIELGAPPEAGNGGSVAACNDDAAFDLSTGLSNPHDTNGVWTDLDASGGIITGNLIDLTAPVVPGTYRFKYKVSAIGPCAADSTIVTVVVSPAPNAGGDGTDVVCTSEDAYDLFAALTGTPDAGGTWSAAQPTSGAVIAGSSVDLRGITTAGTYDFLYIVDGVGVCENDTATVALTVILAADAGISDSVTVCNTNAAYNLFTAGLNGTPDAGGSWTDLDASGAPITPAGVADFTGIIPGYYRFRYIVTGTLPCQNDTSVVTVRLINTTPDPGLDATKDVCNTETAYNLYAALGGTPDPGGDWVDVDGSGAVITGDLINLTGVPTGTYHFRYELNIVGCGAASAVVTLNVTDGPNSGNDTTAPVCTDDASNVNLLALLTGSPDAGGSWLDVDATGVTITPAGVTDLSSLVVGTYRFDYVVGGTGPCKNDTTRLTILLSNPPNAGSDSTVLICTTTTSYNLFTALNPTPTSLTGTWTEVTVSGAPITNGVVNLTGIPAGTYVFQYNLAAIGTCDKDSARVTINYRNTLDAGNDNTVAPCSDDPAYNLFAHLLGTPDVGGVWSSPNWPKPVPANGIIDLRGTAQGTYTFRYIIGAGSGCTPDTATITMNLKAAPSIANAGPDQIICSSSPVAVANLAAVTPTPFFGTGTWVTVSPGGFPVTPNDPNSQYIGAPGRWFMVRWIVTNGTCTPSVDTVIVNFKAKPEVVSPVTVCLNSTGTVKLNASAPGALSYNWYLVPTSGPRTLLANTIIGEYTAGTELIRTTPGSFTYEVTAIYNCGGTPSESGATPITVNVSNSGSCGGSGNPGTPGTCPGLVKIKIIETLPTCDNQNGGGFTFVLSGIYDVTLERKNPFPDDPTAIGLERGDSVIFTNLTAGTYLYTISTIVTPADTCKKRIELELKLKTTVTFDSVRNVKNVTCFGGHDGNATIYAHGSLTGQYYFTYVKNGVESQPKLFTPGAPLPGGLPGDDLDDIIVKIDNSPAFTCPATVSLQIRHTTPEIKRDYLVTGASCNANDGSIEVNNVTGGNGAPYTFSLDNSGTFGTDNKFVDLAGGKHWITIRSGGTGCERIDTVDVTFPGFVDFEVKLPTGDAQCVNNGKSGKLVFELKTPGQYSVGLSNDPTVEPEKYVDVLVTSTLNSTITIDTLIYGDYYLFVKTNTALCATQQGPFQIRGVKAITYDIHKECVDGNVLMSLINLTGDETAFLNIRIFRKFGAEVFFKSVPFPVNRVVAFDDVNLYPFLTIPDEYVIRVTQDVACGSMAADQKDYKVDVRLFAQVGERTKSFPDIFNGKMEVVNFFGGVVPYEIQIKLDSAAVPGQTYSTDWEEVMLNANLDYEKKYDHLPAGRYSVLVQDSIGCTIELIGRVPLDTEIYIPNIFTPNNDGVNDVFFIRNLPEGGKAKLVISDRWGKQVYSSGAYQNNWTADEISDGIYFYSLKIEGGKPISGWVEVLRGTKP